MATIAELYEKVNAAWPDEVPKPTEVEAVRAARRLYRFIFKRTWTGPVVITSGNRYSGVYSGELHVNPDRSYENGGWDELIHNLSHNFFWKLYPDLKPHSKKHARLELKLRKEVVKRGWLDGALKEEERPEPAPADKRRDAYERVLAGIARWEAKERRVHNALVKLRRRARGYERHLALSA